jgi:hypothetical protein
MLASARLITVETGVPDLRWPAKSQAVATRKEAVTLLWRNAGSARTAIELAEPRRNLAGSLPFHGDE